jgi:hypothetical protein
MINGIHPPNLGSGYAAETLWVVDEISGDIWPAGSKYLANYSIYGGSMQDLSPPKLADLLNSIIFK